MDNTANDYLAYVTQSSSEKGELTQLQELAERQASAAARVTELQAQLNEAQETYKELAERLVPEFMDNVGMSEFKTASGLIIKVKETIRASIPKARAPAAYAWLKENGHASLIKRVVSVAFGKGEDDQANSLVENLSDAYEVEDNASVHASTLAAFVREKLAKGEDVPIELFGVHRQRVSEISVNK